MPKKGTTKAKPEQAEQEEKGGVMMDLWKKEKEKKKIASKKQTEEEKDEEDEEVTKTVRRSVRKVKTVTEQEKEDKETKVSKRKVTKKKDIEEEKITENETITSVEVKKGDNRDKVIIDDFEKKVVKKVKTNDSKEQIVEVENTKEHDEVKIHQDKTHAQIDIQTHKTVTVEKLLPREFYTTDVVTLSRELIGKILVRKYDGKTIKAKIVEAEAYAGIIDKACHAYDGKKTDRTKHMYKEGGHCYVYSIYGNNNCLNITASKEGDPSATLIRAVEIIEGLEIATENRSVKNLSKSGKELTNGPGKVCGAMNIDKSFNGVDVTQAGELYIIEDNTREYDIMTTKRINIDYAEEYVHKPWRFCLRNNIFVSVKAPEVEPEPLNAEKKE